MAVLIARHAKPKKRHDLVLLIANLLVRSGRADHRIVKIMAAVFEAQKDPEKAAKVADGEGTGAVKDGRSVLGPTSAGSDHLDTIGMAK